MNIRNVTKKIFAIIIVMIMTIGNFVPIGEYIASYAIGMEDVDENIQMAAYFIDGEEEKINIEKKINETANLKIDLAVKNEGYFDGKIILKDSNFKIKSVKENINVKSNNEKEIEINRITAGSTVAIEAEVESDFPDVFDSSLLNEETGIQITGTYTKSKDAFLNRDNTESTVVQGEKKVSISYKSPEIIDTEIKSKVLTNGAYRIEEELKKVKQIEITSRVIENIYPSLNEVIEISIPEVEKAEVYAKEIGAVGQKYTYEVAENKITITTTNESDEDEKIIWNKDVENKYVVTLIDDEDIALDGITIKDKITTMDNKEIEKNITAENIEVGDNQNGIIKAEKEIKEEIYKGKLYTGEEREYKEKTKIEINYVIDANEIEVTEKEGKYTTTEGEQEAQVEYKKTIINKEEVIDKLGEEGKLEIYNKEGTKIGEIDKNSEADENGKIEITYEEGIEEIIIKLSSPEKQGKIELEHIKAIKNEGKTREETRKITGIREEIEVKYKDRDFTNVNVKDKELKETISKAGIEIINKDGTNALSSLNKNEKVKITATLETKDESEELYKNPTFEIIFPKEVTNVRATGAEEVYANLLTRKKYSLGKLEDGRIVIKIEYEGEQTSYNTEFIRGLQVWLEMDITLNKLSASKQSTIEMNYTNENGKEEYYSTQANINIESQYGLMLYDQMQNFNDNEEILSSFSCENLVGRVDAFKSEKQAVRKMAMINNFEEEVQDVSIVVNVNKEDDFNVNISNITSNKENIEIKYSENENEEANSSNWNTDSTNAKSYKITVGNILPEEIVSVEYKINIPQNIDYNKKVDLNQEVNYSYQGQPQSKSAKATLQTSAALAEESELSGESYETPEGLVTKVVATTGGQELIGNADIYEGQNVKYTITLTNNTGIKLENVNVKFTANNGKIYDLISREVINYNYSDEPYLDYWYGETESNEKQFNAIQEIEDGDALTLECQVIGHKSETSSKLYGELLITAENLTINEGNEIKTSENNIIDGEIQLTVSASNSESCEWITDGTQTFKVEISNISQVTLDNVKVDIYLPKEVTCSKFNDYLELYDQDEISFVGINKTEDGEVLTLNVSNIISGKKVTAYITPYINQIEEKEKLISFFSRAYTDSNKTYISNIFTKKIERVEPNLRIDQKAVLNDTVQIDENTEINDKDNIKFILTINNTEDESADIMIMDSIHSGLEIQSVNLINGNNSLDITRESVNEQFVSYEYNIKAKEIVRLIISVIVNTDYIGEDNITNTYNITNIQTSSQKSSTINFKINRVDKALENFDDKKLNLTIDQTATPEDKTIITNGQEIEYIATITNTGKFERRFNLYDSIPGEIENIKIYINDVEVDNSTYLNVNTFKISDYILEGEKILKISIKGKANINTNAKTTITNIFSIETASEELKSNVITYYTNEEARHEEEKKYTISGTAWIDINENGRRDSNEELIKDMEIKLLNSDTSEIIESDVKTDKEGKYSLEATKGKYIVVFMYDSANYGITTYKADGVEEKVNSDAISKTLNLNGNNITVGATDIIKIEDMKIENIDIGLTQKNKFDLSLTKTVTKVVVQSSKEVKTYNFNNTNLAKVEIPAKYLSGAVVTIEYKIKVTNNGNAPGYVKNIVDYMPTDLSFSSTMNSTWYQQNNYLYNTSLANTQIKEGETVETTLILTKTMTNSNTGLVNNTAEISEDFNEKGLKDINSTVNNKNANENDFGSADVIIGVKTGEKETYIGVTIVSCAVVLAYVYYKKKKTVRITF